MSFEEDYTGLVGLAHRKRLAQFFTPPSIARFMVEWVLSGEGGKVLHDPAFGLGAFFAASPEGCSFTGIDADGAILDFYNAHSARKPERLDRADYLLDFGRQYANIVCNPPYLRFQRFLNRDTVFKAFHERLGIRLSGYTNMASAFLVKSISELSPTGRLAYILPSEFLNCGYGRLVKERLVRDGHLDSLIEVECEREAFGDVTTSVCIILYDAAKKTGEVAFRKVCSLDELPDVLARPPICSIPPGSLDPADKWGKFFVPGERRKRLEMRFLQGLSEYGRFSRGIATGANAFFVMSKSDIIQKGLSDAACVPCITKSQQIRGLTFTDKDFSLLAKANAPVFLFSPGNAPDEASRKYIRYGEDKGYDKGFITRHRTPWFKTETREIAPLLVNVFSRSGYKVVRNYSSAMSLTNFHCFYPHALRAKYLDWLFLYLHSGVGREILSLSKRKYGNDLDKFEPNDLNEALVPTRAFFDALGDDKRISLMDAIRNGEDVCDELDALFSPLLAGGDVGMAGSTVGTVGHIGYLYPRIHEPEQLYFAFEKPVEYSIAKRRGREKKGRPLSSSIEAARPPQESPRPPVNQGIDTP